MESLKSQIIAQEILIKKKERQLSELAKRKEIQIENEAIVSTVRAVVPPAMGTGILDDFRNLLKVVQYIRGMGEGDGGLTASIAKYLPNEIINGFNSQTLDQENGKTAYFQHIA